MCGGGRNKGQEELAGGTEQVLTLGDTKAVGEEQGCHCLLHVHLLGGVLCWQAGDLCVTVYIGSYLPSQSSWHLKVMALNLSKFLCEYRLNNK